MLPCAVRLGRSACDAARTPPPLPSFQGREWRFEELVLVRHAPLERLQHAVRDMRAVLKSDERVLKNLHRRVFLNRITTDGYELIISCYVEAANRDQFMAVKEDFLQVLVQILSRNEIRLASNSRLLEVVPSAGARAAAEALGGAAAGGEGGKAEGKGREGDGKGDAAAKGEGKGGREGKEGKPKPPFSFGW